MGNRVIECIDTVILMSADEAEIGSVVDICPVEDGEDQAQRDYFAQQWRKGPPTAQNASQILERIRRGDFPRSELPPAVSPVPYSSREAAAAAAPYFYPITSSQAYQKRIEQILLRLKSNGLDLRRYGTILDSGYHLHLFKDATTLATTSLDNVVGIGQIAGSEDWSVELTMAHEYRHMTQHLENWLRTLRQEGLDNTLPLPRADQFLELPQMELQAYEKFYQTTIQHRNSSEIDAYIFAYGYYQTHLKGRLSPGQRMSFLVHTKGNIEYYLEGNTADLSMVRDRAQAVLGEISHEFWAILNSTGNAEMSSAFNAMLDRCESITQDEIALEKNKPLHLRERLVFLQAAFGDSETVFLLSRELEKKSAGDPALTAVIERAAHLNKRLDDLFDRQTLEYFYLMHGVSSHRIRYANDAYHTRDGWGRSQLFLEADIDETWRVGRAGLDLGRAYQPLSERTFLTFSLIGLYGGYDSALENKFFGARFLDVNLLWDIDVTQRGGLAFSIGCGLGAQAGTQKNDGYYECSLSAGGFRY